MESPSLFRSDERHFSPQLSVANSLEKIIRNGGSGSGPESAACFYSLAHPTAPVRPVRMINGDFISKFGINRRSRRFTADSTVEANIDFQSEDFSMNLQSPSTTYTRHDSFNKGSGRKGGGVSGYRAPSRCAEYSLLAVEGNLLCTVQRGTGSITLWYISHMTPSTGQGEGRDKVELERLQDVTNISLATSTTVANSSVLEGRHFILRDQRETTTSPSSFLSLSASVSGNNRLSQISGHRCVLLRAPFRFFYFLQFSKCLYLDKNLNVFVKLKVLITITIHVVS